jgi:hypothetical protein
MLKWGLIPKSSAKITAWNLQNSWKSWWKSLQGGSPLGSFTQRREITLKFEIFTNETKYPSTRKLQKFQKIPGKFPEFFQQQLLLGTCRILGSLGGSPCRAGTHSVHFHGGALGGAAGVLGLVATGDGVEFGEDEQPGGTGDSHD